MGKKGKKKEEVEDEPESSAESGSGSGAEEKKEEPKSKTEKKKSLLPAKKGGSLSPAKILAGIRIWFLARTGRKSIGGLAFIQVVCAFLQLLYWIIMPSTTDLAPEWMNRSWIHMTFIVPNLLGGLLGVAVAITCNVRLCRLFFFWLPVSFVAPIPCTFTFTKMKCDCSNYYQCSALADFAKYKKFQYVNPHPIPDDEKFTDRRGPGNMRWDLPPGMEEEEDSSLLQRSSIQGLRGMGPHGKVRSFKEAVAMPSNSLSTPRSEGAPGRHSNGRRISERQATSFLQVSDSSDSSAGGMQDILPLVSSLQNAAEVAIVNEAPQAALTSGTSMTATEQRKKSEASFDFSFDPRKLYKIHNHPGIMLQANERDLGEDEAFNALPTPPRRQADGNETPAEAPVSIAHLAHSRRKCKSQSVEADDIFFQRSYECRTDTTVQNRTACPKEVETVLIDCAKRNTCGGVQFIFREGNSRMWNLTSCMMENPIFISGMQRFREEMAADVPLKFDCDSDFKEYCACKDYDCPLYFERDPMILMDPSAANKVNTVMLEKQKTMIRDEWLEYIENLRNDMCTCEAIGNPEEDISCRVYHGDDEKAYSAGVPDIRYWCPVAHKKKSVCASSYKITDFKEDGGKLWTSKLCRESGCKCATGMGVRIWDADKTRVRTEFLKAAESDTEGNPGGEPIIGYKCDKWFKDDEMPWCVVGFDSTCGDRTAHVIPGIGVTIYSSAVPCTKHLTANVADKAGQTCRIMQVVMVTLDAIRYTLLLPMFYMVLAFLMTRCGDQDAIGDASSGRAFDVQESTALDEIDFFSDDEEEQDMDFTESGSGSGSGSGYGSGSGSGSGSGRGKKTKGKGAGSGSGSGSGDDSGYGSGSKSGGRSKKSGKDDDGSGSGSGSGYGSGYGSGSGSGSGSKKKGGKKRDSGSGSASGSASASGSSKKKKGAKQKDSGSDSGSGQEVDFSEGESESSASKKKGKKK